MNMLASLIVLLPCLLVLTGVRGDTQTSDVDIISKLEALTARVAVLESHDLQHRQHAVVMQTKLARQGRELLYLRRLLERRDKTPPRRQIEEQIDVSETADIIMAKVSIDDVNAKQDQKRDIDPRIRRQEVGVNVAFLATLTANDEHLDHYQNVPFDHVVTNEGNAYDPYHGLFVAPVDGTYVFSTTLTTVFGDRSHFGFALNGNVFTTIWVDGGEKYYDSKSQSVVLKLKAGDNVSFKETDTYHSLAGYGHSLFSGFLHYQTYGSSTVVG